jgi:hypothetical protein
MRASRTRQEKIMRRNRFIGLMLGLSLALAVGVAPAAADHTYGVLDCGTAGTFDVEAASIEPLPAFEAPGPWSGLFLLEGTQQVFRAFYVETPRWTTAFEAANRNPNATVECTLTSSGLNFEEPWILVGQLAP